MTNRGLIDTVLPNMFSNPTYAGDYLFYAHMIGQCSIVMDETLPAAAGVAFMHDHYNLYINRTMFDTFTIEEALGVLKHEMLHILNNHVMRLEDRKHLPWNYATDCAINQLIDRNHLPKITQKDVDEYNKALAAGLVDTSRPAPKVGDANAIFPDTFPVPNTPKNKAAEQYYDMLKNEQEQQQQKQQCSKCGGSGQMDDPEAQQGQGQEKSENGQGQEQQDGQGSGEGQEQQDGQDGQGQSQWSQEDPNAQQGDGKCTCDRCGGSGEEPGGSYGEGYGQLLDDHGKWNESQGDKELQKDLTKQMIDKSINETVKARGNLPSNIEHYIDLFSRKSQISWKKVLKNIVGNKKVNSRRTIMRSDRRFPKREDLRGKTKDRMFDLTVIVDISGSMSDHEIMTGLNEIHHICKMTKTSMKLIQVDTVVHKVEEFSEKTKIFERNGCGGTIMEPAIDYIREHKIPTDACILITDGYIEDVSRWKNPPKYKMMFLVTSEGHKIPGLENKPRWQQFDLKINNEK